MARGVERRAIFIDEEDRQQFLRLLAKTVDRSSWLLHAFSLMANHFHLMVETPMAGLSAGMRWLKGVYAGWFNHKYRRVGPLFQGRYGSIVIGHARYRRRCHFYIHNNAVKAGLVSKAWEDLWNSSQYFVFDRPAPRWLSVAPTLDLFEGGREEYARLLCADGGRDEEDAIGRAIWGDRDFVGGLVTGEILQDPYVAGRLALGRYWTAEEILVACRHLGLSLDGTGKNGAQDRGLAMLLLREVGRVPIAEVASLFGIGKSGVSMRVKLTRRELEDDPVRVELARAITVRLKNESGGEVSLAAAQ